MSKYFCWMFFSQFTQLYIYCPFNFRYNFLIYFSFYLITSLRQLSSAITLIPLSLPFSTCEINNYTFFSYCWYIFQSLLRSCYLSRSKLTLFIESRYFYFISFSYYWFVITYVSYIIDYESLNIFNFDIQIQTSGMFKIIFTVLGNKSLLLPNYRLKAAHQISNIPQLLNQQKKVFIFDKDDTLVPLHEFEIKNLQTAKLLKTLKQKDKRVYVISNSVRNHGKKVNYMPIDASSKEETIDIMFTKKKKPYNAVQIQENITKDTNNMKLQPKSIVVVGDRLFTDVLLGNMQGWTTVFVQPIESTAISKHGLGVYFIRKFENFILNFL